MKPLLVTDCWTRKALCAVRLLGKEGFEVHAVTHTRNSPAIYSKFVKKYYLLPFPSEKPEEYCAQLLALIKREKYDCLMPMDDQAVRILIESRDEFEPISLLPWPPLETYNRADDKWEAMELARSCGVPIPKSIVAKSDAQAERFVQEIGFPIVIKPRRSSGSRGLRKIYTRKDFHAVYADVKERYGEPILQECIAQEGQGKGVAALVSQGETIVSFSYNRLREYPVGGGPSTLRESTNDRELKAYAAKLLKALAWHGVAMVEFKHDPKDNTPKLMEINPRFWGSLHLAQIAGINFPLLLYKLAKREPVPPQRYQTGARSRWLLPGDILHFISNPNRFHLTPSFFSFFEANTYYDQYLRGDPRGNVAVFLCTLLSTFDIRTWKEGIARR